MSHIAIHVESLGKRYRIGGRARYLTMRDRLTNAITAPVRWFGSNGAGTIADAGGGPGDRPNTKPDNSSSRIPELDGLRGAAILVVLVYHFIGVVPGARPGSFLARFQSLFSMGWAGVDLFFVLSGFLIGGILLSARSSPSYFRTFYLRRFFRIIPLYYMWIVGYVLLVAVAGKALGSTEATAPQAHLSVVRQFLFLQNFTFGGYTGLAIAWFIATWSLAVEEQFYLVSPFLVRFLSTRLLSIVLSLTILAAPLFRLFVRSYMTGGSFLAFALTLCRADALAFGMLAAIAWRDPATRHWISSHIAVLNGSFGVMFIGVVVLWKWASNPYGFVMQSLGYSWMALFFTTLLLVVLMRPAGRIAWTARRGWLRELGKVSYCMYIIHVAVNFFSHVLLLRSGQQILNWPGALTAVFAGIFTYVIAKISWILVENPLLKYGHRFQYAVASKVDQSFAVSVEVAD